MIMDSKDSKDGYTEYYSEIIGIFVLSKSVSVFESVYAVFIYAYPYL